MVDRCPNKVGRCSLFSDVGGLCRKAQCLARPGGLNTRRPLSKAGAAEQRTAPRAVVRCPSPTNGIHLGCRGRLLAGSRDAIRVVAACDEEDHNGGSHKIVAMSQTLRTGQKKVCRSGAGCQWNG